MGPDDTIGVVSILAELPGHQLNTKTVRIIISVISHHIPELSVINDIWLGESDIVLRLAARELFVEPVDIKVA